MPEDQAHDAFPHSLHGTAFPSREGGQAIHLEAAGGMSLRDWFAGMAMAAIPTRHLSHAELAEAAYNAADAMLEERAKR